MSKLKLWLSILILSFINILSPKISEFLIRLETTYTNKSELYYLRVDSYSKAINSIYIVISLVLLAIYYLDNSKK